MQLEFGDSFKEKRPVTETVGERIGPTILLTGTGMLFAILVGVTTGVFAGWRRAGPFDLASTGTSMVFYSMPTMWLGLMLIMLFAVKLGWFPVGRMEESGAVYASSWERVTSILDHLVLPALTFGLVYIGQYHLIMRSSVTGVMKEDFVLTGRAKGLSSLRVLRRHIVPNAMLPTFTLIMMNFGFIMSGAILTETVFNWPGLGLLAYEAMIERDYPGHAGRLPGDVGRRDLLQPHRRHRHYYLDPRVQA